VRWSAAVGQHYCTMFFDLWADAGDGRGSGDMIIVRYAMTSRRFQHQADAQRFGALAQRLATFALTLHPDKTRLIEFGPRGGERRGAGLASRDVRLPGFTISVGAPGQDVPAAPAQRRDRMRAKLRGSETRSGRSTRTLTSKGSWLRQVVAATSPTTRGP